MRLRTIMTLGVLLAASTAALAAAPAQAGKQPILQETAPYVYVYPVEFVDEELVAKAVAQPASGWRVLHVDDQVVEVRHLGVQPEPTASIQAAPEIRDQRTPMDWGRDYGRLLILLAVPAAFLGLHLHLSRRAYIVPPSQ